MSGSNFVGVGDFSAINTSDKPNSFRSYLYYINTDTGRVAYYASHEDGWLEELLPNGLSYSNESNKVILKKGETGGENSREVIANKQNPAMSVVAFRINEGTANESREIRIYYKSMVTKDNQNKNRFYLREVCWSSTKNEGKYYYNGALNLANIPCAEGSKITADVDYEAKGQLKVYFKDENMVPSVAFMPAAPGQGAAWQSRALVFGSQN